jgi:hypothetical protein
LHIISPGNTFNIRLKELMQSCSLIDEKEMGFTINWEQEKIWQ